MTNPAIPRDQVHEYAERCSDEGDTFQPTATRLIRDQRRLVRFFEQNTEPMGDLPAQVSLYMLSVVLRIFEQVGGRMNKVAGRDLDSASARIQAVAEQLLPLDGGVADRARAIDWRAQPHILDEILWALYDREEKKEGEADLEPEASFMVYLMLWTAVEALDGNWRPPRDWSPDA